MQATFKYLQEGPSPTVAKPLWFSASSSPVNYKGAGNLQVLAGGAVAHRRHYRRPFSASSSVYSEVVLVYLEVFFLVIALPPFLQPLAFLAFLAFCSPFLAFLALLAKAAPTRRMALLGQKGV